MPRLFFISHWRAFRERGTNLRIEQGANRRSAYRLQSTSYIAASVFCAKTQFCQAHFKTTSVRLAGA